MINKTPGETILFGTYPQTASGKDISPLQWRVLQNSGNKLFVSSEYIVDCKRYHNSFIDTTWEGSNIRHWLNSEFYAIAFSAAQKYKIATTLCSGNGIDSPDTEDRIFLLSVAEVQNFTSVKDGAMRRRTIATDFAKVKKSDGCSLYVYDKNVSEDYIIDQGIRKGCSWWWTRTQLQEQQSRATFIGPRSNIKTYGRVDIRHYGVRPAMWLRP